MSTFYIVLGVLLLVSLPCYIVSRIRANSDKMVLTAGRMDITLLMICPVLVVLGWLIGQTGQLTTLEYIIWGIAFICFALSFMYSIMENKGSVWNMIWSVGAKIFILLSTLIIIVISIVAILVYLIVHLLKELGKSDETVADEEKKRFTLPQYRKFMDTYVGYKPEHTRRQEQPEQIEDITPVE